MAVVVGAPHVDGFVEAAHGQLIIMVGDVGGKVGGDAVGAHQHLVLGFLLAAVLGLALVGNAVFGGILGAAVHDGAVLGLVAGAGLQQLVHHSLHRAAGVQVALMEPHVVLDAVFAQVALQPGDVLGQRVGDDRLFQFLKTGVHVSVAVRFGKFPGALHDVGALVALGGQGAGFFAFVQLQVADGQAFAELFDLVARVIDVELPGHIIPGPVQAGGQTVAQSAAAGIAHVHGAGGVGRNELHVVALARAGVGTAVLGVGAGGAQHAGEPVLGQEQVDEAGPGNVRPGKQGAVQVQLGGDGLGDLAGGLAEHPRPGHGQVGRHIAVFYVGGDLHDEIRQCGFGQAAVRHGGADGVRQQGAGLGQGCLTGIVVLIVHIHETSGLLRHSAGAGSGSTVMSTRLRLMKLSAPESSV